MKNLTTEGFIGFSNCDTIDEIARSIVHRRSDIKVGDVLFASIAPLGRCYLIQSEPIDWDINESVFSLRTNTKTCTPIFLYLSLKSDRFIKAATNSSAGSIFKGIRINTMMEMETIISKHSVLCKFEREVSIYMKLHEKIISQTAELIRLRDELLPVLMNGQVTVKD